MKTMTLEHIRHEGLAALRRRLGVVGLVRFLQLFENGKGNYSASRGRHRASQTVGDIVSRLKRRRKKR
jgi:hypothetical protein